MINYSYKENKKDIITINNLNYNFDKDLHEVLSSTKTDSFKVKAIESLLLEKLKKENNLKPYSLYKNGKLIKGKNIYK